MSNSQQKRFPICFLLLLQKEQIVFLANRVLSGLAGPDVGTFYVGALQSPKVKFTEIFIAEPIAQAAAHSHLHSYLYLLLLYV